MRLKLICVKNVTFGVNNTRVLNFNVGDKAYAQVGNDGTWRLSYKANGVYYGPFHVSDFKDCFVSDFDIEEFEKHFKYVGNVKMYDNEGNLIAEAEHGVANFY